jgi:hypothetical protein
MNVFATLEHKTSTHKSDVLKDAGKTPKWEKCHFDFLIKEQGETIEMIIYSDNALKNKPIGKAKLWVDNLISQGGADEWHEILHDEKSAGKILLRA